MEYTNTGNPISTSILQNVRKYIVLSGIEQGNELPHCYFVRKTTILGYSQDKLPV